MALFIMKWMDLSLKECRMQGLSFLCASPLFGNCVGRPLSSKVPWTYDSLFSWSKIQFQLLELLHQRSSSMPLLEKGDLSFLCVSLVRGRGFGSSIARGIFALPLVGQIDWSTNCSLGVVLVDILEESNSATELLRFLGHMVHCFRGARSSFGSSSFCIRDRTRCHYWRRATYRSFVFLSSLEFVSASLGFPKLDSSREFYVVFDRSN
ncbi:hypothetical protein F2Q70_00022448 [Brassica cretica]|uniref:Uncharacterized protein n=1 Tax=Brassica cretica TaxID=69181 RepID=A0A8S9GWB9_BRACR|nr:hypothetical protein F2Q70_00022448 [Brassica cretica]